MHNKTPNDLVLVTGGSGFIATHCIIQLLEQGYRVRTTVRSTGGEADVLILLKNGGCIPGEWLSFAIADLMSDSGWSKAVEGCRYVLHVASPFPLTLPKQEDDLIIPAREGTLRVLRASRDAGVERVVQTSSYAAIGYGHGGARTSFDEKDWTDTGSPHVAPYTKSKTLAERAAWAFMEKEGGKMELSVINPVLVMGPILGKDYSTSIEIVRRLMDGELPGCPRLNLNIIDVRDVAKLHVSAMTNPLAKGERFIASAGIRSVKEIALTLKERLGDRARRVPA
jgi:dihydroflavonol-4-reductase